MTRGWADVKQKPIQTSGDAEWWQVKIPTVVDTVVTETKTLIKKIESIDVSQIPPVVWYGAGGIVVITAVSYSGYKFYKWLFAQKEPESTSKEASANNEPSE